jgi:hypothetical protein
MSILSSESALMLSWKTMYSLMPYPWHSMKYRIHIMSASLSANKISPVSVELFVLHFIMLDELETVPCPKVTRLPVWPRQSSRIWCDPSIYQCTANLSCSAHSVSYKYLVPFRYFNTRFNFPQSSASGACTRVVRKETAV